MNLKGVLVFARPVRDSALAEVVLSPEDSLVVEGSLVNFLLELAVEFELLKH